MRALILSDSHGENEVFQKASSLAKRLKVAIILICGDITNFGNVTQATSLLTPLTAMNLPLLYVPGNCDLSSFLKEKIKKTQNLHARCKKIKDITFIGVGCAPFSYLHTPSEFSENWLMDSLNRGFEMCSSEKKLIVLSHTPPFNTKVDLAYMNQHIGSKNIRRFIEEKKPLAIFCGHVHEAQGIDRIGKSVVVNPGSAKKGKYALAEIDETVEVTFGSF